MNPEQRNKIIASIGLPLFVVIFYVTASLHFTYTPDDTYIYLQYVKNFIHGNGMSFNAGEPTYGFTSPLWLLLVSLGGKMGVDLYVAAKVMDLFLAAISIALFFILAYEMLRDVLPALLATIAFSFNAWFLRWAGSGMETSLGVMLVLLVFWYCLRNEYMMATVFTTLLTLVRPESFILLALIVVDIYINSNSKRRALKMGAAMVLLYTVFLLPWWIYAYVTFGSFIPNTALAKSGLNFQIGDIVATFWDTVQTFGLTDGLSIVLIAICGVIVFRRSKNETEQEEMIHFFLLRQSILVLVWVVGIIAFYCITGVNVVSRYLLILTPVTLILAYLLLQFALRKLQLLRFVYPALALLTILVVLQNQIVYRKVVLPGIEKFETGMQECLLPIGDWFRVNTPDGTQIVAADIGAIGYRSDKKIFDTAGLASSEVISLLHNGMTPYSIIEKKMYQQFCTPDYVVDRGSKPEMLKSDTGLVPVFTKSFSKMGLTTNDTTFYTVYKVRHTENTK